MTMQREGIHVPAYASAASNPELAKAYPLQVISLSARNFLNSTFVNVEGLRDSEGESHPDRRVTDMGMQVEKAQE